MPAEADDEDAARKLHSGQRAHVVPVEPSQDIAMLAVASPERRASSILSVFQEGLRVCFSSVLHILRSSHVPSMVGRSQASVLSSSCASLMLFAPQTHAIRQNISFATFSTILQCWLEVSSSSVATKVPLVLLLLVLRRNLLDLREPANLFLRQLPRR